MVGMKGSNKYFRRRSSLVTPSIVFVYFYPNFLEKLLLIAVPWGITAPVSMLLLAIMFKKDSEVITQTI